MHDFWPLHEGSWEYWLDFDQWSKEEAARLTICGPCELFSVCDDPGGMCPLADDEDKDIFFAEKIRALEGLLSRSRVQRNISPLLYIQWALSKKSIPLPQAMLDWYARQQAANCPPSLEAQQSQQSTTSLDAVPVSQEHIPATTLTLYEHFLEANNHNAALVKNITAYLLAAKGKTNEEIAAQTGYAISNVTKHIYTGHDEALDNKLPSLMEYLPAHRKERRR